MRHALGAITKVTPPMTWSILNPGVAIRFRVNPDIASLVAAAGSRNWAGAGHADAIGHTDAIAPDDKEVCGHGEQKCLQRHCNTRGMEYSWHEVVVMIAPNGGRHPPVQVAFGFCF
jgi:hypothetical protein